MIASASAHPLKPLRAQVSTHAVMLQLVLCFACCFLVGFEIKPLKLRLLRLGCVLVALGGTFAVVLGTCLLTPETALWSTRGAAGRFETAETAHASRGDH